MPDPFRSYKTGDPHPRDTGTFNAFAFAARDARDRRNVVKSGELVQTRQADLVRIKNETGMNLLRGSVVGLSAPIFTPSQSLNAFLREVTFRGVVPTADHAGKFAILLEPAPPDRVVRGFVSGVCAVKVDVVDPTHTCADVLAGDVTQLISQDGGTAQMLWKEGDSTDAYSTGEQWAYVRFGTPCGGTTTTKSLGKCDCQEASYIVEVDCGDCGPYGAYGAYSGYSGDGATMPKYWWLTISRSVSTSYAYYDGCDIACEQLNGYRIRMANEEDGYGGPTCSWKGNGGSCVQAELAFTGGTWQLTIMDKNDCVLAVFNIAPDKFNCCGSNTAWAPHVDNACDMTLSVDPDPCTCCPDTTCPPDGKPVCSGTDCCLEDCNCHLSVTVQNLATIPGVACTLDAPSGGGGCTCDDGTPCTLGGPGCSSGSCLQNRPTPQASCGGMNGVYGFVWAGDCNWTFKGTPGGGSTKVSATLALSGRQWTLKIYGENGQTAVFQSVGWACAQYVPLVFGSGTCPVAGTPPSASFTLCLTVV
jgi:hypothetical protein